MVSIDVDFSVTESGRKRPEYTLDSDLDGQISLAELVQFLKTALIVTADTVLKEEQAMGFDKDPIIIVDNRKGKPVHQVNPFGKIEIVSKASFEQIILDTYDGILQRSPVDTGQYIKSNFVFLNGRQVATDSSSLRAWLATSPEFKEKDLIRFVNIQPYARKLERLGVRAGKQQSRRVKSRDKKRAASGVRVLAPNGAYFLTTRAVRYKYKANVPIKFSFISGGNLGLVGSFRSGKKGKAGRPYLYPSITITVDEGGVL